MQNSSSPIDTWSKFKAKRVLLLQGPMGPFFRQVARLLRHAGAEVSKINFNVADCIYFSSIGNSRFFRGRFEEWPGYLTRIVSEQSIDALLLFGDCRAYHRLAIDCARKLGVEVHVFEEGYLRPDFVTFERDGVNGCSKLPREPGFYESLEIRPLPAPAPVRNVYACGALHSIVYSILATSLWWLCPRYRHHRDINCFRQAAVWLRGGCRRLTHSLRDRRFLRQLQDGHLSAFFLVPLQVHLDSQLIHSSFRDVSEFIETVVDSFARHAPRECSLILKEHPLDRPYRDYSTLVATLRQRHGLGARLVYVDVVNLPLLLRRALGTVVINSTVGLSSLRHGTPTKCLGRAIYDIAGLTHQGTLDAFWQQPEPVERELLEKFIYWVRHETQLNGSVWTGLQVVGGTGFEPATSGL